MKSIKSILLVLVLTSFTQLNAQKILEKWLDLDNVNQIYSKVMFVANEGNLEILPKYTVILKDYTEKLSEKNVPKDLNAASVSDMIKNLKTDAATLNEAATNMKSKEETFKYLKSFGESLNKLISSVKLE